MLLLLSACVTQERVQRYLQEHPELAAAYCAEEFPIQETLKPGKETVERDTSEQEGPVLDCPEVTDQKTGKVHTPQVKCPPHKVIRETVTRVDTLIQKNTAQVKALNLQLDKSIGTAEAALNNWTEEKESRQAWQLRFWLLLIGNVVAGLAWWYRNYG